MWFVKGCLVQACGVVPSAFSLLVYSYYESLNVVDYFFKGWTVPPNKLIVCFLLLWSCSVVLVMLLFGGFRSIDLSVPCCINSMTVSYYNLGEWKEKVFVYNTKWDVPSLGFYLGLSTSKAHWECMCKGLKYVNRDKVWRKWQSMKEVWTSSKSYLAAL